jgi:ParB/RepB/Spo0J family partition protein
MNRDNVDRTIASVPVAKIRVGERSRSLREEAVVALIESIKTIGLQTPISLQIDSSSRDERYVLVAGLHRLEACRRLGMAHVDARIVDLDETERRLWEISENLHRAELTALERSEHIDQWIKLFRERAEAKARLERLSGQKTQKIAKDGSSRGRPEGGVSAAVRELGIERTEARRSVKIAGLAPEAKAEARALGFDDAQSALLKAAKGPSKEAQIRALREEAARKASRYDDTDGSERRLEAAMSAVKRLSQDELAAFVNWLNAFCAERGERTRTDINAKSSAQSRWTMRI